MAGKRQLALLLVAAFCVGCAQPPVSQMTPSGTPTVTMVSPTAPTSPTTEVTPPPSTPTSATPTATVTPTVVLDVTVTIVRVTGAGGRIEVAAIVDRIVEDGGTCTARAVNGTTVVMASATAMADAQSTACAPMIVTPVTPGTWQVTVAYDSTKHHGVSTPVSTEVTP